MNDNLDPLDNRLKRYYEQHSLPLDTLVELEGIIESTEVEIDHRWRWFSVRMTPVRNLAAIAAAILVFVGLASFLVNQQADSQKIETVAAEIALNHAKQFDSEFFPASIPSLAHSMALLDFAPVAPRRMQLETYSVDGARYCTIDSSIAVQVRLQDEAQHTYTLYEFRGPDSLQIEGEEVIAVGDIEVTLWQEGGVTMGLAQRSHEF